MRILEPHEEVRDGLVWAQATVEWEDARRAPQQIAYAVPLAFRADLAPRPEAFLLVGTLAAMRLGETRVAMDGGVCPQLHEGLQTAMEVLRAWAPRRRPVRLDVEQGCGHGTHQGRRHASALVSGGIDSLALVRANMLAYDADHPARIRTGFVYRGIWAPDRPGQGPIATRLQTAVEALEPAARDAGVTLIPIYANFRQLTDWDVAFWQYEFQAAALASVAQLFSDRVHTMSIGGTWDLANLPPWGSHPLLDSNFGTHDVAVRHEQARLSRMEKARVVAGWPAGLAALRVCNTAPEAQLNCGRCEKCVRTLLTLTALGVLSQADTFAADAVVPDDVVRVRLPYRAVEPDYVDIREELRSAGEWALADAVTRCLTVSRVWRRLQPLRGVRRRLAANLSGVRRPAVHTGPAGHAATREPEAADAR